MRIMTHGLPAAGKKLKKVGVEMTKLNDKPTSGYRIDRPWYVGNTAGHLFLSDTTKAIEITFALNKLKVARHYWTDLPMYCFKFLSHSTGGINMKLTTPCCMLSMHGVL